MWRTLLDLVFPLTCPGCGAPEAWCAPCRSPLERLPRRALAQPQDGDGGPAPLPPVYALAEYRGPVRAVVVAAKEHGRRDLPVLLGGSMADGLARLVGVAAMSAPLWLVPAPTRPSAARARGGDPVAVLCRAAAAQLTRGGLPTAVAPCLVTGRGARDSVGLDAAGRMANLRGRIGWRAKGAPPPGGAVVLIDDVVTTGATLACASGVLTDRQHSVEAAVTLAAVPHLLAQR